MKKFLQAFFIGLLLSLHGWGSDKNTEIKSYTPQEEESQRNAAKELATRLKASLSSGDKNIVIPKGIYRFQNHLDFENAEDVTLDGQGSTFIFPREGGKLRILSCKNTTIKSLFLDLDLPPFAQGTVVSLDPLKKTIDLKLDPGFSLSKLPAHKKDLRCVFYDSEGKRELDVVDTKTPLPKPLSEGIFQISPARAFDLESRKLMIGDKVVMSLPLGGGGFVVQNCSAMTLQDITIYQAASFAMTEDGPADGGNQYIRCNLIRRPGTRSIMVGAADGFHSINQKVGPKLKDCELSHTFDDLVNIHCFFSIVVDKRSPDEVVILGPSPERDFSVGSILRFYKDPNAHPLGEARVLSISPETDLTREKALDEISKHFINKSNKLGLRPFFGKTPPTRVTLDRSLEVGKFNFVSSSDYGNAGSVIEGCYFHDGHIRAILTKSSDSLIQNNRFERIARSGVVVAPEIFFLEGPFPRNIRISDNTFVDCGFGGISKVEKSWEIAPIQVVSAFTTRLFPQLFTDAVNIENIEILRNKITNSPGPGILIMNSRNVKVSDNVISNPVAKKEALPLLDFSQNIPPETRLDAQERDSMIHPYYGIFIMSSEKVQGTGNLLQNPMDHLRGLSGKGAWTREIDVR